jgi:hypothetical protein
MGAAQPPQPACLASWQLSLLTDLPNIRVVPLHLLGVMGLFFSPGRDGAPMQPADGLRDAARTARSSGGTAAPALRFETNTHSRGAAATASARHPFPPNTRARARAARALTHKQVGNEVARRAKGLGLTVIAHDPYASEDKARALGVQLVSFDEALARVGAWGTVGWTPGSVWRGTGRGPEAGLASGDAVRRARAGCACGSGGSMPPGMPRGRGRRALPHGAAHGALFACPC